MSPGAAERESESSVQKHSSLTDPLIDAILRYQEVCNRHGIAAAVACFTDEGYIEDIHGQRYGGRAVLRAAHEYDRASAITVTFGDFTVTGDTHACRFVQCTESIGSPAWTGCTSPRPSPSTGGASAHSSPIRLRRGKARATGARKGR